MTDRISERPLDLSGALAEVSVEGGPTCVFAGTVRRSNRGKQVVSLTYEAHRPLGERVLRALEEEAESEASVLRCRIVHRAGTLRVGDISVLVAVAARTPEAAVEAARRTMDELKERLPMWKEERYADGETHYLDGSPLRSGPAGGESPGAAEGGRAGDGDRATRTAGDSNGGPP